MYVDISNRPSIREIRLILQQPGENGVATEMKIPLSFEGSYFFGTGESLLDFMSNKYVDEATYSGFSENFRRGEPNHCLSIAFRSLIHWQTAPGYKTSIYIAYDDDAFEDMKLSGLTEVAAGQYEFRECLFENMIPCSYDIDYLQTGVGISNPAVTFSRDAKGGVYNDLSDAAYYRMMERVRHWSRLWCNDKEERKISLIARYAFLVWYESFCDSVLDHSLIEEDAPENNNESIPFLDFKNAQDVADYVFHRFGDYSSTQSDLRTAIQNNLVSFIKQCPFSVFYDEVRSRLLGHDEEIRYPCYCIYSYLQANALGQKAPRSHFIITGTSGCGKTELLRVIRAILAEHDVTLPIIIVNSATMSYEGYKGANLSEYVYQLFNGHIEPHGMGIFVLDEIDKKVFPIRPEEFFSSTQELLTILDGEPIVCSPRNSSAIKIDTDNILFVGIGTFARLRKDSDASHMIGFNIERSEADTYNREFDLDYLAEKSGDYEFFGRFERVINFKSLPQDAILEIIRRTIKRRFDSGDLTVTDVTFSDTAAGQLFDYGNGHKGVRDAMNRCVALVSDQHALTLLGGEDTHNKDATVFIDDVDNKKLVISYVAREIQDISEQEDDDDLDSFKQKMQTVAKVRKKMLADFVKASSASDSNENKSESNADISHEASKKSTQPKRRTAKTKTQSEASVETKKKKASTRTKTSSKAKKS